MRVLCYVCANALVTLAFATTTYGQPPQTPPGQAKKRAPSQTVDHGTSDANRDLTPEEEAAVDQQFGKNLNGARLNVLPNGIVRIDLDESFMEAMTATIDAEGSLTFGEVRGLAAANESVKADATKKTDAIRATAKKPAPKLEEKE
jgi:hypothetical protein